MERSGYLWSGMTQVTGHSALRFKATSGLLLHPIENPKEAQLFVASRLPLQTRFYPTDILSFHTVPLSEATMPLELIP